MQNTTGRISSINLLRAFVCFCIITKHFTTAPNFSSVWGKWIPSLLEWVPGVECFLVVSGFFLAQMFRMENEGYLSVREFMRRRIYRLVVPYWIALGLAYLGLPLSRAIVPGDSISEIYRPKAILANLVCFPDLFGFGPPMLFFWTVATLIQAYAVWSMAFWLIRRVYLFRGKKDYHPATIRALVILTGITAVSDGALMWTGSLSVQFWQLPRWLPYIALGAWCYWTCRGQVSTYCFAILLALFAWGFWESGTARPLYGAMTAALLILAGKFNPRTDGIVLSVVSALGNMSYSIYLMHGLVGRRLWAVFHWLGLESDTNFGATCMVLAAMLASVIVGWMFYRLVERPMAERASRIGYRR